MSQGSMTIQELARLLGADRRHLERRAQRGEIPCQKVQGELRFNRFQINDWLRQAIPAMDQQSLAEVDAGITMHRTSNEQPIITPLLRTDTIDASLDARTKSSTLRKLISMAEQTGQVYDTDALRSAVLLREEHRSTALGNGIAIPHPHGPLPYVLAESILVVARTTQDIVFGGALGGQVDLFFLTASPDCNHHIHILARLCRMLQDTNFVDELRNLDTADQMRDRIIGQEMDLLAQSV